MSTISKPLNGLFHVPVGHQAPGRDHHLGLLGHHHQALGSDRRSAGQRPGRVGGPGTGSPACLRRACKKLSEARIIRQVAEDETSITFQFTQESRKGDHFEYALETMLSLEKATGKVSLLPAGIGHPRAGTPGPLHRGPHGG